MRRRIFTFALLLALLLPSVGSAAAMLDLEEFCPTTAAPKPASESAMDHGATHGSTPEAKPSCCCGTGCCEMGQSEPPIEPPVPTPAPPVSLDEGLAPASEALPAPARLRVTAPPRGSPATAPDLFLRHRSLLL